MLARFGKTGAQKANAAFTLVEIMVAVGVLGIMMAAFFTGLASGLGIVNTARQDLRATQILTQKTEAVRLLTWDQLHSLPINFVDYYYPSGTTNSAPNITYYGTISVGPASCIPSSVTYYSQIDLVTISLVWTNSVGADYIAHSRSTQTLVSYYGLVNYIYGQGFVQQ
jgi:prepilin-type N-terminal cleavage/methylation domain-containing protein